MADQAPSSQRGLSKRIQLARLTIFSSLAAQNRFELNIVFFAELPKRSEWSSRSKFLQHGHVQRSSRKSRFCSAERQRRSKLPELPKFPTSLPRSPTGQQQPTRPKRPRARQRRSRRKNWELLFQERRKLNFFYEKLLLILKNIIYSYLFIRRQPWVVHSRFTILSKS